MQEKHSETVLVQQASEDFRERDLDAVHAIFEDGVVRETDRAFTAVPRAHVWDSDAGLVPRFQQYTDPQLV